MQNNTENQNQLDIKVQAIFNSNQDNNFMTSKKIGLNLHHPKYRSVYHLMPLFVDIFELSDEKLIKDVESCLVNLDNLAIEIDTLIDSNFANFKASKKIKDFAMLDYKIDDCFNPLTKYTEINHLLPKCKEYINKSLLSNTTNRHKVYSISNLSKEQNCTMYYLYPLLEFLLLKSKVDVNFNQLFVNSCNFIQIIDDFVDMYNDEESNLKTPITIRHIDLIKSDSVPFATLAEEFKKKLKSLLFEIKSDLNAIFLTNDKFIYFHDWKVFYENLEKIPVPKQKVKSEDLKYLDEIIGIVPPILCYY